MNSVVTLVTPAFPVQIAQEEIPVVVELPKLAPDQQAFVLEVFKSQEQQKIYLAQKLQEKEKENKDIEQERRRYQEAMLRHAAAFSYSIVEKFVETINKTPELQKLLNINPKNKAPLKLDELVDRMRVLLEQEQPPKGYEEEDWVWCKRGLESAIQPIVDDINIFLKTFGVDNLKKHCPELLQKDLEEQIRLGLNPPPEGPSKLAMAGTGLKYTFYVLYYMCGLVKDVSITAYIISSPSLKVMQVIAEVLLKIVLR